MPSDTTVDPAHTRDGAARAAPARPAFVVVFCREEPHRVGEVLFAPKGPRAEPSLLGRGGPQDGDAHPRAEWIQQRPGTNTRQPPLVASAISRAQLVLSPHTGGVHVRNVGRRSLRVDGATVREAVVRLGQTVGLDDELTLRLIARPVAFAPARAWPASLDFPFGGADPFGVVGESEAAWALRDQLAFAAQRPLHVLLHGPTGTGKELAARAIHALTETSRPLVSRNAATLPEALLDAELFGNRRDYPNPGMPERAGLVGAADGSTLFLDEVGELPLQSQAHLLRVLDSGEYQRLGDDASRVSRFRFIGATNRPLAQLKHDLLARLTLRIKLPPLADRLEDLPSIANHLVVKATHEDEALRAQLVDPSSGRARIAPELLEALLRHRFEHGVRELLAVLWRCIQESHGAWVRAAPDAMRELEAADASPGNDEGRGVDPDALSAEAIGEALEQQGWVVARAWRPLGLKSRHVLNRLIKKHGIERPD